MDIGVFVVSVELMTLMTIQVSFPDWHYHVVLELSTTRTLRLPAARLKIPLSFSFIFLTDDSFELYRAIEFYVSLKAQHSSDLNGNREKAFFCKARKYHED